MLVHLQNKIF
uniref:Uncharacterized protein n=1 Tax=Anguilla anguilla TaxID=7936 RepID=A0A0E9UWB5_ANGAN